MKTQQFKSFLAAVCLFLAACSGFKSASKAEEAYSSASAAGDAVYVDVVSFAPVSGIYDESEKMHINKNYSDIVAEAFTSDGDLIHVMFKVDEYKKEIDPDLDLSNVIVPLVVALVSFDFEISRVARVPSSLFGNLSADNTVLFAVHPSELENSMVWKL